MSRQRDNEMPFDVDLWRSDEEVALLGCVGRTVWFESLMVMWKRDRNGELSGTVNEIAKLCRVSPAEALAGINEIKLRNVGDVTDSNGCVTLVCRGMKRASERRASVRDRVSKHRSRGERNGRVSTDVTHGVTQLKQHEVVHDPPPSSPSLTLPPPISPTSPISSKSGDGSPSVPPIRKTPEKTRDYSGKSLSEAEQAVRESFTNWWINTAFPAAMQGEIYPFDGKVDAPAVLKVLRHAWVSFDLERAKAVANHYLTTPDAFIARQGRPLSFLSRQLHSWILGAQLKSKGKSDVTNTRTSTRDAAGVRPGEFPEAGGVLAKLAEKGRIEHEQRLNGAGSAGR